MALQRLHPFFIVCLLTFFPVLFSCEDAEVSGGFQVGDQPSTNTDDDSTSDVDADTNLSADSDTDRFDPEADSPTDEDLLDTDGEEENAPTEGDDDPAEIETEQEEEAEEFPELEPEMPELEEEESEPTCAELGGSCTTGEWDRILSYPCDSGFYPSESSHGCESQWLWCCAPMETGCIAEGRLGDDARTDACCNGLTRISNRHPSNMGGCDDGPAGTFLCTDCGDGVCGLYENKCNCAEDCASAGECSSTGPGCPTTTCLNRDSFLFESECVEYIYNCDPNSSYCLQSQSSFPNYLCNMNTGRCELP